MNRLVDIVILLLLGMGFQLRGNGEMIPVLAMLVGLILAALSLYLPNDRKFAALAVAGFAAVFFLPEVLFFLPILIYFGVQNRIPWMAAGAFPVIVQAVSGVYTGEDMIWFALIAGLSVLLALRTGKIEKLQAQMIRMRDSSTELNLALQEKNRNLREKQDYEIYLATLRERNRIAREIHDNVGHMLSRSILQMGALGTIYKEEPLHGQLASVNDTLNQAMNSIRESVHDLHDDSVDLHQAVLEATKDMRESYRVEIDYDMSKAVPRNVKYCFIATVKEAMSNVMKHSDADRVDIVLREHPGFYRLFISDNGTVKTLRTQENGAESGIGLYNMRERVEGLGGTIHFSDEQGFRIMISIRKQE